MKEFRGRIFKRPDNKYFVYIPVSVATDSMFPYKQVSEYVLVSFDEVNKQIIISPFESKSKWQFIKDTAEGKLFLLRNKLSK